jgi:hypothetical protein
MFDGTKVQTTDDAWSTQVTVSPGVASVCAEASGAKSNIAATSTIKTADFTFMFNANQPFE